MIRVNVYKRVQVILAACLLMFGAARFAAAADDQTPDALIKSVAQQVLKDLDAHRAEYRKDPKQIRALVDKNLLPYFDTEYAARRVLAKHWNEANEEQRKRFIEAFYQSMLQNYGTALLDFTPDRLQILPFRNDPSATSATVKTQIKRDNGSMIPVNYALHKVGNSWKAYDVTIEGVSYVKSFQTDYGAEIDRNGLESVIKRLEAQVASGTLPNNAPGKKAGS